MSLNFLQPEVRVLMSKMESSQAWFGEIRVQDDLKIPVQYGFSAIKKSVILGTRLAFDLRRFGRSG